MPTYEYACDNCGHAMEAFQRMSEDPLTVCPECEQSSLKRKIGLGAGIIFKGGGFYETDFKDRKGAKGKESSDTRDGGESKESKETRETPAPAAKSDSAAAAKTEG